MFRINNDEDHTVQNLSELLEQYRELINKSTQKILISLLTTMLVNEKNTKILSTNVSLLSITPFHPSVHSILEFMSY